MKGDSKEHPASLRSIVASLDGSSDTFYTEAVINGTVNDNNEYRSPFKTTSAIKFRAKFKSEKNAFVHDLAPYQRANGAMAAKFR